MRFPRRSGVILHPTSLPGPYGIGEIGPHARTFADALREMGQGLWQILPIGPTSYGDSPYQCLSTFAGNPLWISFELLAREGLLSRSRLARFPRFPDDAVDFGPVIQARFSVLHSVCRTFARKSPPSKRRAFEAFCRRNQSWLDDFALFAAIKDAHQVQPWVTWELELRRRDPAALAKVRRELRLAIRDVKILQFIFDDQWQRLRRYCHKRDIRIIGDIPIFVAHDSADVWAHPDLFHLDENGRPTVVAGVPPDYFSSVGQRWGNPLYRWDAHERTGFQWWVERLHKTFDLVDVVRIDHFRGFEAYWEIPASEPTAMHGRWVKGPNDSLFSELHRRLGRLPIIAEDLGIITPDVEALRDRFEFPGMRILQFAFGNDDKASDYRPENYPENCVVYTGTHDNDTTVGWFNSQAGKDSTRSAEQIAAERRTILEYLKTDGREIHWDMIRLGLESKADTFVAPLQDVLGLGSEGRMNVPGRESGNWSWRFRWEQLTPGIRERLRRLAESSHRVER